jgi:hypothetical protein
MTGLGRDHPPPRNSTGTKVRYPLDGNRGVGEVAAFYGRRNLKWTLSRSLLK